MPTYKYCPPQNIASLFTNFVVYDPITRTKEDKRILPTQSFTTDRYYGKEILEKSHLEFVSDEPYVSPVLISYSGNDGKTLEVPEYNNLIDIYVSLKTSKNSLIKIYFNGNKNNALNIYNSGKLFRNISVSKIRTITVEPINNCDYTIALVDSEQFAGNNTGEQSML